MSGEHQPEQNAAQQNEIAERLAYWSRKLEIDNSMYLVDEATDELDELWEKHGLMNRDCLIQGFAVWSEDVDPDIMSGVFPENIKIKACEISGSVQRSMGFTYTNVGNDDTPRLYYLFEEDRETIMPHPTRAFSDTRLTLLRQENAAITPLPTVLEESLYNSAQNIDPDEIGKILLEHSVAVSKVVTSNDFRGSDRHTRIKKIDDLIAEAEAQTDIWDREIQLAPKTIYVVKDGIKVLRPIRKNIAIAGLCRGLDIPDKRALTRNGQIFIQKFKSNSPRLALNIELLEDDNGYLEALGVNERDIFQVMLNAGNSQLLFENK